MEAQKLINEAEIPEWDRESFQKAFYPELRGEENPQVSFFESDLVKIQEKGLQHNAETRERDSEKHLPSAEELIKEMKENDNKK